MSLNAKIGGFIDFLAISGCDTSLYHSQGVATELYRYAIQIKNLVYIILTNFYNLLNCFVQFSLS